MFSQPPELECYTPFSCVWLHIAINNTLSWFTNSSHASCLTFDNNVITAIVVMFHKHFRTMSECFRDVLTKHSRNVLGTL